MITIVFMYLGLVVLAVLFYVFLRAILRHVKKFASFEGDAIDKFFYYFRGFFYGVSLMLIIYGSYLLIERVYITASFYEPAEAINQLIADATDGKECSSVFLTEEEWEDYKDSSPYIHICEGTDWNVVKEVFQSDDHKFLNVDHKGQFQYKATYHFMKQVYDRSHHLLQVTYYPDFYPREEAEREDQLTFFVEKIDGMWRVTNIQQRSREL